MNAEQLTGVVIADLGVIVVVSALFGALARRCGHPTVIGQIVAGIALGPTLLGRLPGDPAGWLFPAQVRPSLSVLSQIAVVIFMFAVGYEVDLRLLRRGGRSALCVASLSLAVPMTLGAAVAVLFREVFTVGSPGGPGGPTFVLFMAVAISITALPVLAAIVRERGLAGTAAGTVATAAAGLMDVAAWTTLAAVLAETGDADEPTVSHVPWMLALPALTAFAVAMFLVVRPLLGWLTRRPGAMWGRLPAAFALALGSAWGTAALGLHPVFGGLLAGLVMPRRDGAPEPEVLRPMEQTAELLLPLFFVMTGLSADISAIEPGGLILLAVLLVAAIGGKLVPAYAASRLTGLDSGESAVVAVLVNTRGLTELIVLDVGLSAHVIDERLFTVLVVMALITTAMTAPLLTALRRREERRRGRQAAPLSRATAWRM
ncbi:cation:proton antiporter [Microbispora sp. ATCC PTA-5024]|uniref:cation:proton antiporter n=1 Tax=Microbispora sp. ATCC PTA-5024 TaxID=316330 RepID=UPI0003DC71D9|nr:cation:proton antiporter [Microbispora sp. ATCC PTA-5024]ETK34065.1 sodium/proton antiporter [Microbispora sp. ATCC PTA-5024]